MARQGAYQNPNILSSSKAHVCTTETQKESDYT